MIGKIGPLVQGSDNKSKLLITHLAGGTIGGLILGMVVGWTAVATQVLFEDLSLYASAGVSLAALGMIDLGLAPGFSTTSRQTPGSWTCSLGPGPGVFAWGLDLGFGLATRPASFSALALPILAVASGSFWASVVILTLYGTARAAIVMIVVERCSDSLAAACTRINKSTQQLYRAIGGLSAALGLGVIVYLMV